MSPGEAIFCIEMIGIVAFSNVAAKDQKRRLGKMNKVDGLNLFLNIT